MTAGEIYKAHKEAYDSVARDFIKENLSRIGDKCHRPNEMMTSYSRYIVEKISDELYISYIAYVKEIKYSAVGSVVLYNGKKDDAKIHSYQEIVEMFGFEISINPRKQVSEKPIY